MAEKQVYKWTPEFDEMSTGTESAGESWDAREEEYNEEPLYTHDNEEPLYTPDIPPLMSEEPMDMPDNHPQTDAEELARLIETRKRRRRARRRWKKTVRMFALIIIFIFLFTMCGKEIFRLKAENKALKKQHEELAAERDKLARELESVSDKEYIKDQARKQLRLLDPGEIMFIFDDSGGTQDDAGADEDAGTDNND